tara:strand:- start:43631 stop:47185 length:3555 start_codon:yes stop_codon:yes gene_type:complete
MRAQRTRFIVQRLAKAKHLPLQKPQRTRAKHPYQGFIEYQGVPIDIENRADSYRRGVADDGTEWASRMAWHYGEVRGTIGADGDPVDVFVGPDPFAPYVYVIQTKFPGAKVFDETKSMLGFHNQGEAVKAFRDAYDKPGFYRAVQRWTFGAWREAMDRPDIHRGKMAQPLLKAKIRQHVRKTKSGLVQVKQHERKVPTGGKELVSHYKKQWEKHGEAWPAAVHHAGQELHPDEWSEGEYKPTTHKSRYRLMERTPADWHPIVSRAHDLVGGADAEKAVTQAAEKAEKAEKQEKAERDYEAQGVEIDPHDPPPLSELRGKMVWLYHGTTTKHLKTINRAGISPGQQPSNFGAVGNSDAVQDVVFLTAQASGQASAAFYAKGAARRHGGDPTVLRVLVSGDTLSHDADDEDISSGGYQFTSGGVAVDEIIEVDGERIHPLNKGATGEGSRGGTVVGHTRFGHPIYRPGDPGIANHSRVSKFLARRRAAVSTTTAPRGRPSKPKPKAKPRPGGLSPENKERLQKVMERGGPRRTAGPTRRATGGAKETAERFKAHQRSVAAPSGKQIGRTESGHSIHSGHHPAGGFHEEHAHYKAGDHDDAAAAHEEQVRKHVKAGKKKAAEYHGHMRNAHQAEAREKRSGTPDSMLGGHGASSNNYAQAAADSHHHAYPQPRKKAAPKPKGKPKAHQMSMFKGILYAWRLIKSAWSGGGGAEPGGGDALLPGPIKELRNTALRTDGEMGADIEDEDLVGERIQSLLDEGDGAPLAKARLVAFRILRKAEQLSLFGPKAKVKAHVRKTKGGMVQVKQHQRGHKTSMATPGPAFDLGGAAGKPKPSPADKAERTDREARFRAQMEAAAARDAELTETERWATRIRVSDDMRNELEAQEVDTFDPDEIHGDPGRADLVDAFENATKVGKYGHQLRLSEDAARYMIQRAGFIENSIDIWQDTQSHADHEESRRMGRLIQEAKKMRERIAKGLAEKPAKVDTKNTPEYATGDEPMREDDMQPNPVPATEDDAIPPMEPEGSAVSQITADADAFAAKHAATPYHSQYTHLVIARDASIHWAYPGAEDDEGNVGSETRSQIEPGASGVDMEREYRLPPSYRLDGVIGVRNALMTSESNRGAPYDPFAAIHVLSEEEHAIVDIAYDAGYSADPDDDNVPYDYATERLAYEVWHEGRQQRASEDG